MGEEEKKPEETKAEEPKKAEEKAKKEEAAKASEKPAEEKKPEQPQDAKQEEPAPPPPEIVLKVFMHCEGCARKVRRSLKRFPGVEDVITDCKSHKVVVKGEKADPLKVLERVQRKSHRQVELLSPIPKPPTEREKKAQLEEEKPKPEEKKPEPQVVTVVLKVHMHCEACAQEIKRRIQRMKGVESVEADLKSSQVSVKGAYDPSKLVEYVYKRTGKHALIVKQKPELEKKEEKPKEEAKDGAKEDKKDEKEGDGKEKKSEEGGEENKEQKKEEGEGEVKPQQEAAEEDKVAEVKKSEYCYYPPSYGMEVYALPATYQQYPATYEQYSAYYPPNLAYPPQIFSDENPNACTVM